MASRRLKEQAKTQQRSPAAPSQSNIPLRQTPGAVGSTSRSGGAGSHSSASSRTTPRAPVITLTNRELPDLDEEEKIKLGWTRSNLKLAAFSSSTAQKPEKATSNFFKINMDRDVKIHKYRIVLGKAGKWDITRREARRDLIKGILEGKPPTASTWVCDYFSHIISVGRLYREMNEVVGTTYKCLHQRPDVGGRYVDVDSTIYYEGTLNWGKLQQYINPTLPLDEHYNPEEDFRILNMLSWKHIYDTTNPAGDIKFVGKKFYPPAHAQTTPLNPGSLTTEKKEIAILRRGFFSSVRPGNGSLYLNVNTATSAFYPPGNLYQYLEKRSDASAGALASELKSLRVIFDFDALQKVRVIERVLGSDETSGSKTFSIGGQNTTVLEHITRTYSYDPSALHEDALCVVVGQMSNGTDIIYPSDTLRLLPWQPFKGKMSRDMTTEMLDYAMRTPKQNEAFILDEARGPLGILDRGQARKLYSAFGFKIEEVLTKVNYCTLRAPTIRFSAGLKEFFDLDIYSLSKTYQENKTGKHIPRQKNGRNLPPARDSALWSLRPEANSQIQKTQRQQVVNFGKNFVTNMKNYGLTNMHAATPKYAPVPANTGRGLVANRMALVTLLQSQISRKPGFLVVVLPDRGAETYANVRWWADCIDGYPIMCISPKILELGASNDKNVFANLSLKTNYRLGGTIHCLKQPLPVRGTTMIVGADVTHPGKVKDKSCPSMAGVVATYDDRYMTYLASARLQTKNTEHISDLKGMIIERLQTYINHNKQPPEHILFYRDGVSESQFGEVRDMELNQIIDACQDVADDHQRARITLVIVGKRHHTRFYPSPPDSQNIKSGLLVDETVVAPKQFNFYLQAHDSPIGTARNAHYVVLENESQYDADELQLITNNLCFTASKATKGLSVCTPARYADTLCDRLRRYMRPAMELEDHGASYPNRAITNYSQDQHIWNAPRVAVNATTPGRTNPWHPSLNNSMFYL